MPERRVLFCSYHAPQGDRDSGSGRMLNLIRYLNEDHWSVSFAAASGLGELPYVRSLQQQGVLIYDASKQSMPELLSTFRFDLVVFAFWPTAEFYLPMVRRHSPGTRVIVDSIDLNFLRNARRVFAASNGHGPAALLDAGYGSQLIAEINTYAAADAVMAISQKEADWIADLVGRPDLAREVPLSYDRKVSRVPFAERNGILFVGNFQHSPNVDAVRFLCEEVLPQVDPGVLREHPVYIVGNALSDSVRRYGSKLPNVRMVGWVPSLDPYLDRSRVSILPLTYGAGIKGKLIQALMSGTPSVSTSIGVEGMDLRDGEHVLVADDPAAFASSIARLATDAKLWKQIAQQGHEYASRKYSRKAEQTRFREVVSAVFKKKAKPALLPDITQAQFWDRVNDQYYIQLLPSIRDVVRQVVPPEATVIVSTEGSNELLKLDGRRTWHFLQDEKGNYRPGYHANSEHAIAELEALRANGGEFLILPRLAFWSIDPAVPRDAQVENELAPYRRFKDYLDQHYPAIRQGQDVCAIHDLRADVAKDTGRDPVPTESETSGGGSLEWSTHPTGDEGIHSSGPLARAIAFYLPQFHPIPENNEWWGEGFTEWSNVTKAEALFEGHDQPRLPADLGFYDLRLADTREEQVTLAKAAGLHGFCYYHYWFQGKRLLEQPFNEVLKSGKPDFPFCLCWANEPWSRRWDGRAREILQAQSYSDKDDLAHIRWLLPALSDRRAIQIEGKPVFLVYQAKELPDPAHTTEVWREAVAKAGLKGIYLIAMETGWDANWDATLVGFDAKVLFQPQFTALHNSGTRMSISSRPELRVFDYQRASQILSQPKPVKYRRYETVVPRWDNTARAGESAVVLADSTPQAYEQWLRQAVARVQHEAPDHRVVFINAWNEWAEGAHLEPDLVSGHGYLDATRRALHPAVALDAAGRHPAGAVGLAVDHIRSEVEERL